MSLKILRITLNLQVWLEMYESLKRGLKSRELFNELFFLLIYFEHAEQERVYEFALKIYKNCI